MTLQEKIDFDRKNCVQRINYELKNRAISHSELATLLGISNTDFKIWLNGEHDFTSSELVSIYYYIENLDMV